MFYVHFGSVPPSVRCLACSIARYISAVANPDKPNCDWMAGIASRVRRRPDDWNFGSDSLSGFDGDLEGACARYNSSSASLGSGTITPLSISFSRYCVDR